MLVTHIKTQNECSVPVLGHRHWESLGAEQRWEQHHGRWQHVCDQKSLMQYLSKPMPPRTAFRIPCVRNRSWIPYVGLAIANNPVQLLIPATAENRSWLETPRNGGRHQRKSLLQWEDSALHMEISITNVSRNHTLFAQYFTENISRLKRELKLIHNTVIPIDRSFRNCVVASNWVAGSSE